MIKNLLKKNAKAADKKASIKKCNEKPISQKPVSLMINIRIYRGLIGTNGFFGSPELYKIFILYNIFDFFR